MLLHDHRQIHTDMHTTIVVERPSGVEWPNRLGLIDRIKRHIGDHRRVRFLFGMGRIALPTAVGNDVHGARLIHQRDALAFLDGDTALGKVGAGQANRVAGRTGARGTSPAGRRRARSTTTGGNEKREKREKHENTAFCFHEILLLSNSDKSLSSNDFPLDYRPLSKRMGIMIPSNARSPRSPICRVSRACEENRWVDEQESPSCVGKT